MSVFTWISLLSSAICAANAVIVFHSNSKARVNRYFAVSSLALSLCAFSEFMFRQAGAFETAFLWTKVNIFSLCATVLFLCFIVVFTGRDRLLKSLRFILLFYAPALFFICVGLATDLISGTPVRSEWGYVTYRIPENSIIYYIFNFWLIFEGLVMCVLLILFFIKTSDRKWKSQAKYFIAGIGVMVAGGTVEILLSLGGIVIPSTASAGLVWLNACVAYAVWRQDLFALDLPAAADRTLATMPDPLLLVDAAETVRRVNPAFLNLFGCAEPDVLGRPCLGIFAEEAKARRFLAALREAGALENNEVELATAAGESFPALLSGALIRNRRQQPWGFVLIIHDLSERIKAEEALRRLAGSLERTNRELEVFNRAASHDLKEPLAKILRFSRVLLKPDETPPGERTEFLESIHSAAERMQRLIDGLLKYARLSSERPPFEPVDLTLALSEALANLEVQFNDAGAAVEAGPLPVIRADPLLMQQLFQNLIGNALKYRRPDAPPRIRISAAAADGFVTLEFADNGIGFDNQYRERIFGLFQRLVEPDEYEGAGIGLSICRKIAEIHGGAISASGQPGDGSVFTVVLPLAGAVSRKPPE